jgi:hypothetical protein
MNIVIRLTYNTTARVWAHKVIFSEFPGIVFAVHPFVDNQGERDTRFAVTEVSSGAHIWSGLSPSAAIKSSRAYLNQKGVSSIKPAIEEFVKKYGLPEVKL